MKKVLILIVAVISLAAFSSEAQAGRISRQQAVRTAHSYLSSQAFSFKGLVDQLEYEGYSVSDSRYAASHSGANWMREAVQEAREYLSSQGFSRRGLIDQLEYEGFTPAQAIHGVNVVGL